MDIYKFNPNAKRVQYSPLVQVVKVVIQLVRIGASRKTMVTIGLIGSSRDVISFRARLFESRLTLTWDYNLTNVPVSPVQKSSHSK